MGVDGYRCDVAPLVPLDFWLEARERINRINPDFIWLSESVHKSFIKYIRDQGFEAHSDGEMYQAFDILYDYDIIDHFHEYLRGEAPLKVFLDEIRNQETIYPNNYVKLRNLEIMTNQESHPSSMTVESYTTFMIHFRKGRDDGIRWSRVFQCESSNYSIGIRSIGPTMKRQLCTAHSNTR